MVFTFSKRGNFTAYLRSQNAWICSGEPGSAEEIRAFCDRKYAVKFPLFEKVKTKGADKSPVYAFLTEKFGEPKWNFHKYLVGKDGQVVKAFSSKVTPESPELRDAIDAALK